MREHMVFLQITKWQGAWFSGGHYYGKLVNGDESVDVEYTLTAADARGLNRADRKTTYREGLVSGRFASKEKLIVHALKLWQERFPQTTHLIEGRSSCASPQPVLVGPRKDELNALYNRAEQIGWFDGGHREEMNQIDKEWNSILGIEWS